MSGTVFLWTKGASGTWETFSNWTPSGPPTSADTAELGDITAATYTVTVSAGRTDSAGILTFVGDASSPTLSINGSLTVGTIVYAFDTAASPIDINAGGKLNVTTGIDEFATPAETITVSGLSTGGHLTLGAPGIGEIAALTFTFNNTGPTAVNTGVIEIDGVPTKATTTQHITNVARGDEFVLPGNTFTGDTVSLNTSTNVLTVTKSGTTVLTMDNMHLQSGATNKFTASGDVIQAVCYVPGTCIATPAGETAVEDLQIGDLVVTASGAAKPIKWIGRQSYSAAAVAECPQHLPVLIRKDALGAGLPRRDLMVSPMHSLFLDDEFVPASALVNGVSILRRKSQGLVEYIHIELHEHDVLLAEGVPAESFVDDDSRTMFDNASEYYDLYGFAERQRTFCTPRLEEGYRLEAIRRRFASRAGIAPSVTVPGEMAGHVERLHDGELEGWVMDRANPDTPVELEVRLDGEIVAMALANRYRPDLDRAGLADGRCAFLVAMPATAEDISQVEVRRASDGSQLPMPRSVRQRLAERVLQRATTTDPNLRLRSRRPQQPNGRPVYQDGNLVIFNLPRGSREIRLISRAQSPSEARPWLEDGRRLGIRVQRIALRSANELREIPMDHPDLTKGWWDIERDGQIMSRWTNGDAVVPLPAMDGPVMLEIHLAGEMIYAVEAEPESQSATAQRACVTA